jgi:cytochrome c
MPARLRSVLHAAAALCVAAGAARGEDVTTPEELAFNNHCRECHTVDRGDNRLGPTLYDVIGRKAGSLAGFPNYSSAVQDSGVVWDAATLDKWIANPNAFLPDNNMAPFAGVTDAKERALIISYLESKSQVPSR